MKTYLVGGAVRDQLLGINVIERDWVVVGATVKEMLDQELEINEIFKPKQPLTQLPKMRVVV